MTAARRELVFPVLLSLLVFAAAPLGAQNAPDGTPEIHISRTVGAIVVDGDLSDPGWKSAARVDTFYETNPGDNVPPKVRNVAYLAYDDKFFYAAFEFSDPDPSKIRAPYGDRDDVASYTDYGGIILAPADLPSDRLPGRHRRKRDQPLRLPRLRDGRVVELLHAPAVRLRPGAQRDRDVPPPAARVPVPGRSPALDHAVQHPGDGRRADRFSTTRAPAAAPT